MHHLEYTTEVSFFIAHSDIIDVDEEPWFVDPEVYFILFATAELLYNLFDEVDTGTRMAVLYITPDDVLAAREDAVIGVGVEAYDLVFIDIREVNGHMLIDEVDLLERHLPSSYLKESSRRISPAETILTE